MTFEDGICDNCKKRKVIRNKTNVEFQICDQSCGKHPANSGHPLSPCIQWECEDDEDGSECYRDEDAIAEGNRCFMYCAWLNFMHEMRREAHGCSYPFCKGCQFIEITAENKGICRRDDDWTEYKGYEVWNMTKDEHLTALKPCPFCGGNPIEDFEREELGGDKVGQIINWSVYCTKCYAEVFSCESEEDARAKWNKRASE